MKFRGGEFPTGTKGNFQPELTGLIPPDEEEPEPPPQPTNTNSMLETKILMTIDRHGQLLPQFLTVFEAFF